MCLLKVYDENSWIRIRIRIHAKMLWIRNTGLDIIRNLMDRYRRYLTQNWRRSSATLHHHNRRRRRRTRRHGPPIHRLPPPLPLRPGRPPPRDQPAPGLNTAAAHLHRQHNSKHFFKKGLSNEIDLAFDDMYDEYWAEIGVGPIFNF